DMAEQVLNLEERKEFPLVLASGWKLVDDNPLKLVVTQGRAWLYGTVTGVSGTSAPYAYNGYITMAPTTVD
ncbi:hypothetical protein, partial [Ligilactobacillus saerimneri]